MYWTRFRLSTPPPFSDSWQSWFIAAVLKTVDLSRVHRFKSYTILHSCGYDGIGRHEGLKIPWDLNLVRVQVTLSAPYRRAI